jgi:hypothetical protein
MALHPTNDRFKVKVDNKDEYNFGLDETQSVENGVVVEVPDVMIYLSFHSFAFERSFAGEKLKEIHEYYKSFLGKRIYWETFQDKGRRIKEGDDEFVFLQMTDLLAYSDPEDTAETVKDTRNGSFSI